MTRVVPFSALKSSTNCDVSRTKQCPTYSNFTTYYRKMYKKLSILTSLDPLETSFHNDPLIEILLPSFQPSIVFLSRNKNKKEKPFKDLRRDRISTGFPVCNKTILRIDLSEKQATLQSPLLILSKPFPSGTYLSKVHFVKKNQDQNF